MKHLGAERAGPMAARLIHDNATRARVGAASAGSSEAMIFHQPHDSGFGWFLKSDDTQGLTTYAMRMKTANGFQAGGSISSYEATFFHSTSDDISLGDMDVTMELWDGDPASMMETVCTIGGVSSEIQALDLLCQASFYCPHLLKGNFWAKGIYSINDSFKFWSSTPESSSMASSISLVW